MRKYRVQQMFAAILPFPQSQFYSHAYVNTREVGKITA